MTIAELVCYVGQHVRGTRSNGSGWVSTTFILPQVSYTDIKIYFMLTYSLVWREKAEQEFGKRGGR